MSKQFETWVDPDLKERISKNVNPAGTPIEAPLAMRTNSLMSSCEYLYRIFYHGNKIYEGDEDNARLMFKLLEDKEDIKFERAQLVWWDVPPENFISGTT